MRKALFLSVGIGFAVASALVFAGPSVAGDLSSKTSLKDCASYQAVAGKDNTLGTDKYVKFESNVSAKADKVTGASKISDGDISRLLVDSTPLGPTSRFSGAGTTDRGG